MKEDSPSKATEFDVAIAQIIEGAVRLRDWCADEVPAPYGTGPARPMPVDQFCLEFSHRVWSELLRQHSYYMLPYRSAGGFGYARQVSKSKPAAGPGGQLVAADPPATAGGSGPSLVEVARSLLEAGITPSQFKELSDAYAKMYETRRDTDADARRVSGKK
jgi:hypothetical protein